MFRNIVCALLAIVTITLIGVRPAQATPSAPEAALIERLISQVAGTQNMVFIRNGSEHDAADAAAHLRDKYAYFNKEIVTADDFIRLCGTQSEMTHLPYKVRMADGTTMPSAQMLKQALAKMRAGK